LNIKRQTKKLIEKLTGTHIYRVLPHGVDLLQDITNHLTRFQVNIVFDVGANVGQSANKYLDWFPKSQIYCFEPVRGTFRELQGNLKSNDHIHCFHLAFGASKGKGEMVTQGSSDMFFLSNPSKGVSVNMESIIEKVDVETLYEFCSGKKISQINYLKIDTEGGDLEVLRGSEKMLSKQTIDLVEVEAGMNCRNERHVPFEVLKQYLESKKYYLFGIYEQVNEWPSKEPHLRRTNPVFISERVINANKE
jgi:FkbM family methyltransferase